MSDSPASPSGFLPRASKEPATQLSELWRRAAAPDLTTFLDQAGPLSAEQLAAVLCVDQRQRWLRGERPLVEDYLRLYTARHNEPEFALDLLFGEFRLRRLLGETPSLEEYQRRFPDLAEQLALQVKLTDAFASGGLPLTVPPGAADSVAPGETVAEPHAALPARLGRYELLEEIGRGGMGAVLRGHDPDLGRDLAVKVLLPEHQHEPAVLCRFTEEAQIGGQLQHPGIVPVYEVGRSADQRPYFTMKLVTGRTLAALLGERSGPGHDLPRFLHIFEAVCQTTAYAHSRNVIHRDLKPANVMVGAFGEVQVMDWGLAKVLEREEETSPHPEHRSPARPFSAVRTVRSASTDMGSRRGDVMGTPPYMAPEQAAGQPDRLDERCDVFGLGAILCEILTGQPPYIGTSDLQILLKAFRADLDETFARLDRCGADAELIDLTKWCLTAESADRPRHAGVVAERVQAHQAAVQERLRRAELERAEALARAEAESRQRQAAQAQARAERRALRLTVGLAGVGLLVVALGGWGAWLVGQQRLEQGQRSALARDDLEQFDRHIARVVPQEALAKKAELDEAQKALERAESRLGGVANEELKDRVRQAREDLERLHREQEMLARLEEAMLQVALVGQKPFDWAGAARRYAEAFAWYGVDVEQLDIDEAARRIAASALREQLRDSLDFWIRAQKTVPKRIRRLRKLADEVDTSPWGRRLRQTERHRDTRAGRQLMEEAKQTGLPVARAVRLAIVLADLKLHKEAVEVLEQASRSNPADFWVYDSLGLACFESTPPRKEEAVRYFTAAVALRPDSAAAHNNLGAALARQNKLPQAEAAFKEAIRLKADFPEAHNNLGKVLGRQNKPIEAEAAFRETIRFKSDHPEAHYNLGITLEAQKKFAQAVAAYREAVRLKPDDDRMHINLGNALQAQNKLGEAVAAFREAIRLNPNQFAAHYNLGNALAARNKLAEAEKAYREAIRRNGNFPLAHCELGHTLRLEGKFDEALAAIRRGHELGMNTPGWRHPSALWVRMARRAVELNRKLPALLKGDVMPKNAAEQIELAELCFLKRWHSSSARFYADAFAASPDLANKAMHRYNAACAAALAGSGRCEGPVKLDDRQRADLRRQALGWLNDERSAWASRIDSGDAKERALIRKMIEDSRTNRDLAGVRDGDALGKLPAEEREKWQKLWAGVAELRKKLENRTKEP
jgi:serine/threonine-protein kinase